MMRKLLIGIAAGLGLTGAASASLPVGSRAPALKTTGGEGGALLDVLAQVTASDIDDFRAGIEPLAVAGKLGALLAQWLTVVGCDAGVRAGGLDGARARQEWAGGSHTGGTSLGQ